MVFKRTKGKGMARKVDQLTKAVNNLKKSNETKYHDENLPLGAIVYGTNNTSTLLDPAQGSTTQTRVGNEISPYRVHIKGRITVGSTEEVVRITLIQSKQGYVPSSISTGAAQQFYALPASAQSVHSPLDENNRKHYVVLYDKTFTLDAYNKIRQFSINKKISRNTMFEEAGSTTAEKGQVYLIVNSNVAASGPTINAYSRIFYKD